MLDINSYMIAYAPSPFELDPFFTSMIDVSRDAITGIIVVFYICLSPLFLKVLIFILSFWYFRDYFCVCDMKTVLRPLLLLPL